MDNYKDMVRMGIKNVLPVWHQSEPFEYLEKYCDMTDYVCIGGLVGMNRMSRFRLISQVLKIIPKHIKIHLFGVTDIALIRRFGPFVESCDSSSWKAGRKFAIMLTPSGGSLKMKRGFQGKALTKQGQRVLCEMNILAYLQVEREINRHTEIIDKDVLEEVTIPPAPLATQNL